MKLEQLYELIIKKGLEKDPRSKKELQNEMKRIRKEYRALKGEDKKFFDKEMLKHPFADTRILYGNGKTDVRSCLVGIDIGGEELLTAYHLNEKGAGIDLAMSHHPSGRALSNLAHVMHVQADILRHHGLDAEMAKNLVKERLEEVSRRLAPANTQRSVDIARLLDIPFMCAHTPADNHVAQYLQKLFDTKKPKKAKDVLNILKAIPEYQDGMAKSAGPQLIAGKGKKNSGKVFVDMTGGTEGPKRIFARLSQAGVGTIVGMHLSEEHFKMAKAESINVVIAGHIASDNLGINLLLDEVTKKESLNIIPCSGFVRIKR